MNLKLTGFMAVWWLLSTVAYATPFNEIDRWDSGAWYSHGEVVTYKYDIYINIFPIKGIDPESSVLAWKKVDYRAPISWDDRRLFFTGQVITDNQKYYIARRINIIRSRSSLRDDRRWMEFTHPGLSYSIPEDIEDSSGAETLGGVDSNANGIRDDYELEVLFSDLPKNIVESALDAGLNYGRLIAAGKRDVTVHSEALLTAL